MRQVFGLLMIILGAGMADSELNMIWVPAMFVAIGAVLILTKTRKGNNDERFK